MIKLELSNQTARRLSYLMGHSDEANVVVQAALGAARSAEQHVRDLVGLIATQAGEKLPDDYTVEFHEEENHIRILTKEERSMNGVNHE